MQWNVPSGILATFAFSLIGVNEASAQLKSGNYVSTTTMTVPGAAEPRTITRNLCITPDQTGDFFVGMMYGFISSRGSDCRQGKHNGDATHVVSDYTCKDVNGDDAQSHFDFKLGSNRIDVQSTYTAWSGGKLVTVPSIITLVRNGSCETGQ